jgi:hypothetical protein
MTEDSVWHVDNPGNPFTGPLPDDPRAAAMIRYLREANDVYYWRWTRGAEFNQDLEGIAFRMRRLLGDPKNYVSDGAGDPYGPTVYVADVRKVLDGVQDKWFK